jgi:hypothetical protein
MSSGCCWLDKAVIIHELPLTQAHRLILTRQIKINSKQQSFLLSNTKNDYILLKMT